MKGLLKILTVFGLTTPLAVNVVACGSDQTNSNGDEVTENTNVQELLEKAKDQVNLGLGDLIEGYKNLSFEDEVNNRQPGLGTKITDYLNGLSSDSNSVINNNEGKIIKNAFLNQLQKDINDFVVDKFLIQNSELKSLFGNIPINEFLVIDINQTILTKMIFKWKPNDGVNFGLDIYTDPKVQYNITMWHKLMAQLKLKLTYKNESNVKSTYEFDSNFNFNYANSGAKLSSLIHASTGKVEAALKGFTIEVPPLTSVENLNSKVKEIISNKISNDKVDVNGIEILPVAVLKKYDKYDSGDHMYQAITQPSLNEAVASLKNYLAPVASKFTSDLNNWIGTGASAKKITADKSHINNFGTCTISNWTISGLTLKPFLLDFVTSRNETQIEWGEKVATVLATTFYTNGSFAKGRIDLTTNDNLTIYMNPSDFDNYFSNDTDKSLADISDYISQKVNASAKNLNIITNNNIFLKLNGLGEGRKNPILSDGSVVKKVDDKTFIIERSKNGMHGYNYLSINYDNVHFLSGCVNTTNKGANKNKRILFKNWVIKKADSNVW